MVNEHPIFFAPFDKKDLLYLLFFEPATLILGTRGQAYSFSLAKKEDIEVLTKAFLKNQWVIACLEAKPTLRQLISYGIDIKRPVCLRTLYNLIGKDFTEDFPEEYITPPNAALLFKEISEKSRICKSFYSKT